jgi:hypothetical protein
MGSFLTDVPLADNRFSFFGVVRNLAELQIRHRVDCRVVGRAANELMRWCIEYPSSAITIR